MSPQSVFRVVAVMPSMVEESPDFIGQHAM